MTMPDPSAIKQDGKVQHLGIMRASPITRDAIELLKSKEQSDFATVLNFMDRQDATDFALSLSKCKRHKLKIGEGLIWLVAKSRCAEHGDRAKMFSQTLMGVAVPEFYGGKGDGKGKVD